MEDTPRWWGLLIEAFKRNGIRLITYVPDRVLTPLIEAVDGDDDFDAFAVAREEEGFGIVAGSWMAGCPAALLMQTSGFATLANVLASLAVPSQIPVIMVVSERGTLGEHNLGQALVCRTMRPVLDALAVEHHTITHQNELLFIADQTIKQAFQTRMPATLILSPLLTNSAARSGRQVPS